MYGDNLYIYFIFTSVYNMWSLGLVLPEKKVTLGKKSGVLIYNKSSSFGFLNIFL